MFNQTGRKGSLYSIFVFELSKKLEKQQLIKQKKIVNQAKKLIIRCS